MDALSLTLCLKLSAIGFVFFLFSSSRTAGGLLPTDDFPANAQVLHLNCSLIIWLAESAFC
jgi:hypothetical protein